MYNTSDKETIAQMLGTLDALARDIQELYESTPTGDEIESQCLNVLNEITTSYDRLSDLINELSYLNRLIAW